MGVPYYQQQLNSFVRSFAAAFNDIMLGGDDLNGDEANYSFFTGNDNGTEYYFGTSIAGLKAAGETSIAQNADVGTSYSTYAAQSSSKSTTDTGNNYSSYYKLTAANFCVNSEVTRDPSRLAATSDITGNKVDAYDIAEKLEALKSDTKVYRNGTAEGFLKSIISDISIDTQESKIFYNNYSNIENTMSNQRMSISGVDEDEEGMDLVKFQNAYNLSSKMVSVMAEIYDRLILETGV
jgi:flagellar hook-associated protein 1 FlgK